MTEVTFTADECTTTLARIRAAHPCEDGWRKLLAHLGKTAADDEPLPLLTVLDSNGLDDALWVLSFAMPSDRLARHFGAWCAEQVLPNFEALYPDDTRPREAIRIARDDAASAEQRSAESAAASAARSAAWSAAVSAEGAAVSAEGAARSAADSAAWSAAWSAEGAAWSAAEDAARAAAWDAAWDAARAAQERQLRAMLATVTP